MADVKTTPNDEDVDAFIESVSDPHKREDAKTLKALLRASVAHLRKNYPTC